jgi:FlaA1/EpsC-like NDP-sugar epimerase
MIQGPELPLLSNWQNFYMLIGTASATLTGLMFVVTTLIAGIDTHVSTLNAAVSAYNTPTVVHFGTVLLLAGILSAPWQTSSSLSVLLGLLGLGMVVYSIIVMRRMRRVPNYQSTLEDWLWYMALPLLANVLLIVAAYMLPKSPSSALYIVGSAMMLLLLVGIRNAWDMVTFLAVERSHSETKNRESRRGSSKSSENRMPKK